MINLVVENLMVTLLKPEWSQSALSTDHWCRVASMFLWRSLLIGYGMENVSLCDLVVRRSDQELKTRDFGVNIWRSCYTMSNITSSYVADVS